ncbi:hypothetical protein MKZ38_002026 [Zalerion maritima]|uniref:Cyclin-dependent protein kinase regulator pho80 n=1 Tax=Zalerion maritima TaxID=339359 RepID=A0AAD5WSQ6_9PEZI|nr:hypothetical protein MKZ38_002026 [Zalerion maritima]
MKIPFLSLLLPIAGFAFADRTVDIYIQPVQSSPMAPIQLAEIKYSFTLTPTSEVTSYEAPDIPEGVELLRVGLFDPDTSSWSSSTSVISVQNFDKGYSPKILLSVDVDGNVVGASCFGVLIDAGQTRDFGPQSMLLVPENGKQPSLNKPVVLSREGKKVVEEEKSFFQKYWWLIGIAVVVLTMGGGDQK